MTDTTAALTQPTYEFREWIPSVWDILNTLKTPAGVDQRLVIIPAQYSAATAITGTLRVFDALTYTVYYTGSADDLPPSLWQVQDHALSAATHITVEVTDRSAVRRVAVGYTDGIETWRITDLARSPTVAVCQYENLPAVYARAVHTIVIQPYRIYLPLVLK